MGGRATAIPVELPPLLALLLFLLSVNDGSTPSFDSGDLGIDRGEAAVAVAEVVALAADAADPYGISSGGVWLLGLRSCGILMRILGMESLAAGAAGAAGASPPRERASAGDDLPCSGNNDDDCAAIDFACIACSSCTLTVCLRGRFPPEEEDGNNEEVEDGAPRPPTALVEASKTDRRDSIFLTPLPRRKLSLFPLVLFFFFAPVPASRDTICFRAARCALRRARFSSRRRSSACWRFSSACSHFS